MRLPKKSLYENIVFYGPILAIKNLTSGILRQVHPLLRYPSPLCHLRCGDGRGHLRGDRADAPRIPAVHAHLQARADRDLCSPEPPSHFPGSTNTVPSTFAVWFAFVVTIAIHEFGHGILCRVEKIAVRGMGALVAVIPIGFFVEPDEEQLEKTRGMSKIRMFGAGITNNIVVGVICFVVMILLVGMAVPAGEPVIAGVYQNYSAWQADVPTPSVISSVNGIAVQDRDDVSSLLNATRPGDTVALGILHQGTAETYHLNLSSWPEELGPRESGFMGVYYYDGGAVVDAVKNSFSFTGFIRLITVPFDPTMNGQMMRILAFETPESQYYQVPFPLFWGVIHLLFWCGWININVGIFNAIPMVPLDGGYILKEGVERLFERRGIQKYALPVVSFISSLMLVILFSLIVLPYIFHF